MGTIASFASERRILLHRNGCFPRIGPTDSPAWKRVLPSHHADGFSCVETVAPAPDQPASLHTGTVDTATEAVERDANGQMQQERSKTVQTVNGDGSVERNRLRRTEKYRKLMPAKDEARSGHRQKRLTDKEKDENLCGLLEAERPAINRTGRNDLQGITLRPIEQTTADKRQSD